MGQRTTAGSTKADQPPSSSKRARTKEIAADPRRMMTSWSLNCSRMSSQIGVGGSSAMAGGVLDFDLLGAAQGELKLTVAAMFVS
jgi:hypothetical protein